jgi:hypothetical protein
MSETVALKQELLAASQKRVGAYVTKQLDVEETLAAVLSASFASPHDAIEMLFDRHSARELSKSISDVRLNKDEMTTVLNAVIQKRTSAKAEALLTKTTDVVGKIETCLVATLREEEAAERWKLPLVRVAVLSAFLCDEFDPGRISSLLACFVDADKRRGDDFHAEAVTLAPNLLVTLTEVVVDAFL